MQNFWTLNEFVKNAVMQKVLQTDMFAVDLNQFMQVQRTYVTFLNVPWLVRLCADDILRRGLRLEGLFRVPGNHEVIARICKTFNNGEVPDFSGAGLEEVSGVYKKYIRELPQALLTCDLPDSPLAGKFAAVLELPSEEQKVVVLKQLVKEIPSFRRALAKEIFLLLYLVSLESESNLMDCLNLATIFGGMVNIISSTMFSDEKKNLCCTLIEFYPEIFGEVDRLKPLPVVSMSSEQKMQKTVVSIFLDDGTFKTFWAKEGDTAIVVRATLLTKLIHLKIKDEDQWQLFHVQDREVRKLADDELIIPLIQNSSCILFTNKFDISELSEPWHVSLAKKSKVDFQAARERFEKSHVLMSPKKKPDVVVETPTISIAIDDTHATPKSPRKSSGKTEKVTISDPKMEPETDILPDEKVVYPEGFITLSEKFCAREQEYSQQLTAIKTYATHLKPILCQEDYNALFSNLDALLMLHSQLASRLSPKNIFSTVSGMMSYFKMYGQVKASEQLTEATLQKVLKDDKIKNAINKHKKTINEKMDFLQLVLLPQKRMQEFEDSLKALSDHVSTLAGHIQVVATKTINQISLLNVDLNEQADISKSGYLLLQISREVDNLPADFEVMSPSRRFISECSVFAKIDSNVIRHPCHLYLFNDVLFVVAKTEEKKKKLGRKKKEAISFLEFLCNISESTVVKVTSTDDDFIGDVVLVTNGRGSPTYYLHTDDAKRLSFLVQSCVSVIKSSKQTFETAIQKKAEKDGSERTNIERKTNRDKFSSKFSVRGDARLALSEPVPNVPIIVDGKGSTRKKRLTRSTSVSSASLSVVEKDKKGRKGRPNTVDHAKSEEKSI